MRSKWAFPWRLEALANSVSVSSTGSLYHKDVSKQMVCCVTTIGVKSLELMNNRKSAVFCSTQKMSCTGASHWYLPVNEKAPHPWKGKCCILGPPYPVKGKISKQPLYLCSAAHDYFRKVHQNIRNWTDNYFILYNVLLTAWLRCCATNRKVARLIPDGVTGIFHWHNPSHCTMALGSTQPLKEMSTRSISWG